VWSKIGCCGRYLGLRITTLQGNGQELLNDLHYLNFLPGIIQVIKSRRVRWVGHVARVKEKKKACRVLVGKSGGKRALRTGLMWEDNIKIQGEHKFFP
jgi:hypothetical protein